MTNRNDGVTHMELKMLFSLHKQIRGISAKEKNNFLQNVSINQYPCTGINTQTFGYLVLVPFRSCKNSLRKRHCGRFPGHLIGFPGGLG